MGKRAERIDVKHREGVLAVIYTAFREDNRYEMDAGRMEKGQRCGFCKELQKRQSLRFCHQGIDAYPDVDIRDVSNNVV